MGDDVPSCPLAVREELVGDGRALETLRLPCFCMGGGHRGGHLAFFSMGVGHFPQRTTLAHLYVPLT